MKRLWLYLSALVEDSRDVLLFVPLIANCIVLFLFAVVFESILKVKYNKVLAGLFIITFFSLGGIQGLIFAHHKTLPIIWPPLTGKPAVLLATTLAIVCFVLVAWAVFTLFQR